MLKTWPENSAILGKSSSQDRKLSDWLDGYLDFSRNTEPPVSYHRWVGIGTISAALQRKVYLDWGMERIYPNLYICLLGPAATTRKSTALRIGETMAKALRLRIIGQDNSPEAVIRDIKGSVNTIHDGHDVKVHCSVACFASELAVFLGRQNTEFQAYLTDWYDSPDNWKRTTKHQGIDDISGMYFTLVGAMAPDWIPFVFSPESIGGGFTSRIVFVSETKKAKTIANPNLYPIDEAQREKLAHDLERIHLMIGRYQMSDDAMRFYEEWYEKTEDEIQRGIFPVPDRTFHTYCGRRATLLRKLGMVLAASARDERSIEREDLERGLSYMVEAEKRMPGIFASIGKSPLSHQTSIIAALIQERGEVKKSLVMAEMFKDVSAEELDAIEKALTIGKMIHATRILDESDTLYKWIGD